MFFSRNKLRIPLGRVRTPNARPWQDDWVVEPRSFSTITILLKAFQVRSECSSLDLAYVPYSYKHIKAFSGLRFKVYIHMESSAAGFRRRGGRGVYSYSSDTIEGPGAPAVKLTLKRLSRDSQAFQIRAACPGSTRRLHSRTTKWELQPSRRTPLMRPSRCRTPLNLR